MSESKSRRFAVKQAGADGTFSAVVATLGVLDRQGDIIERGRVLGPHGLRDSVA